MDDLKIRVGEQCLVIREHYQRPRLFTQDPMRSRFSKRRSTLFHLQRQLHMMTGWLTCLGRGDSIDTVHEGLLRLAIWRLTSLNGDERPKHLTLDIDGLPIEVFIHQGRPVFHGYVGVRIYSQLIASLAETGDLVGGLLREGNAGPAENAYTWIPHLVRRFNESLGAKVRVCIDAGFTDNDKLEALEDHNIEYLGRLRGHSGL